MRRTTITLLAASFWVPAAAVAEPYGVPVVSAVRSVYDGDTFRVDVEGWPRIIGSNIPIRLRDWDTPELRSRCDTLELRVQEKALGHRARDFTARALAGASTITLHDVGRGSFFRVVADVHLDGEPLANKLIEANLAIPEESGSDTWCRRIEQGAAQ